MSLEEFKRILFEVKNKTDYLYLHVKGEPLLHPQIIDFLKLAEKNNLKINLTTNGTLFPNLVNELKNCKALNKINFSLHCENNYPNYLENIFDNVKLLPQNVTIIYRLWTLNNLTLDKKSTEIVGKIKEYYHLSPDVVEKLYTEQNIKIKDNIYVDKDNEFVWPQVTENKTTGYCHALKTHIAILVDGTVIPCCLDAEGVINLGNIFDTSLAEIITSDRYQTLKKSFQDHKPSEKLCASCTFKNKG